MIPKKKLKSNFDFDISFLPKMNLMTTVIFESIELPDFLDFEGI